MVQPVPELTLNFIKGDEYGPETEYRDALPVNMYAVERPVFGSQGYMCQEPGITEFVTDSDSKLFLGADRGGIWNSRFERHYRVSGQNLIQLNSNGTVTRLGEITGSDNAKMAYSFNNLAIVADKKLYMYNPDDGLRQITDEDVGKPIDITWIDQYFVLTDGKNLYHTSIVDETTIDPSEFATSEFSPDGTTGLGKTVDNFFVAFNRYTTEFFRNIGGEPGTFAFARSSGRAVNVGTLNPNTKCEIDDNFYTLGNRKGEALSIYALTAGRAQKVATREVEKILSKYTETDLSGAVLEGQEFDGYQFLLVHLPEETLKLNLTIAGKAGLDNAYSIIKTGKDGQTTYTAIHGVFDAYAGKWIYGDKTQGRIGYLDNKASLHYDSFAEWYLNTPFYPIDSFSINEIEIKTVPGFTTDNDATVAISLSQDGVNQSSEAWTDYASMAQYNKRFIIRRLGYTRDFVSIRMRGVSRSRMAFSYGVLKYG